MSTYALEKQALLSIEYRPGVGKLFGAWAVLFGYELLKSRNF